MTPVRVLIVDDEPEARRGLKRLLAADPDVVVVGESADGRQAGDDIARLTPDLVLLDVQMPERNGFEVLEALEDADAPAVIFITAHDAFALKAFEAAATDYLLKPFTDQRFHAALERAKRQLQDRGAARAHHELLRWIRERGGAAGAPAADARAAAYVQRLAVSARGETRYVDVGDLDWLEADGYCTRAHAGAEEHLLRGHLALFERRLDPARFTRIHRGCIVNLSRVKALRHWFRGDAVVVLTSGKELRVSRTHRARLEAAIERSR